MVNFFSLFGIKCAASRVLFEPQRTLLVIPQDATGETASCVLVMALAHDGREKRQGIRRLP